MLDPVALQVLAKAIDFLFDEGKKILEERRERRTLTAKDQPVENTPKKISDDSKPERKHEVIKSKEIAIASLKTINEAVWQESKMEIDHLLALLDTFKRNYYLAKQQYAQHGSAYVPPIIVNNLTEAENGIAETLQNLQTLLTHIYGKKIVILEDEEKK